MSWFGVSVAIFFACFFETSKAQCPGVPITFGLTEIYMCRSYAECNRRSISGCVHGIQQIVHLKVNSPVQRIRQGAVKNMKHLISIDMRNINLEDIDAGAFLNIPSIDSIAASNNKVAGVRSDVFSNLNFRAVDLTSNQITNIDDFAFAFMPRLYGIYLSRNLIESIRSNWFYNSTNIGELILSNNKIAVINSDAFSKVKRLDYLDLSFNGIHHIDDVKLETKRLDVLNLAGNRLTSVAFLKHYRILRLYISLNNISYVESPAANSMVVRYIFVHPNPWQCTCLKQFWKETQALEENADDDFNVKFWSNSYPLCVEKLNDRDTCTMKKDEEFAGSQEEYFKAVNYIAKGQFEKWR